MNADVAFIHPPSIYDFRKKNLREGPVGDVIPSTPLFEMYPVGFVSMLNYLIQNGHSGRISNIAVLMLSDRNFDAERYIRNLDAEIYGIDLHWLPHVHGAFKIAEMVKKYHPDRKVLLGGFSATYFAEDIMRTNPYVDFILSGDFVEKQLLSLVENYQGNRSLDSVPNLVYRQEGKVRTNPRLRDENPGDAVFIDYGILVKNSIKYHDVKGHLPYYSWIENPIGMTLIQRGCQMNCGFCGGSNFAYRNHYFFTAPVRRDPARVADEMLVVKETINSPMFVAGDLNLAGEKYYDRLFTELKERGLDLPLLTEYFYPPGEDFFRSLSHSVSEFACEMSPESSNERIRRITGKRYSNSQLEKSIDLAGKFGSKKFDLYLTIGLPEQTGEDVLSDCGYLESLMRKRYANGMQMYGFISPLAPFVDPGSLFYENSEKYGYKITARNVMAYYDLLERGLSWVDYLNYETKWMSRDEIARTTYVSGLMMTDIAGRLGYLTSDERHQIREKILQYMNGSEYEAGEDKSSHLTYLIKEIDWSHRHGISAVSLLVLAYHYYEILRRTITSA